MIIETLVLDSGLGITLTDETCHYFGGYYHVKVHVRCDIPLEQGYFENAAEFSRAVAKMGAYARFERILEKMAVPEAELESVRSQLIQAFHETTKVYLSIPDFAPRFVRSEYQNCIKNSRMNSFRE